MIDVRDNTIILHDRITIDGYPDYKNSENKNLDIRLQSHFHHDHLKRFISCFRHVRKIFLTEQTKQLIKKSSTFSIGQMLERPRQVAVLGYDEVHKGNEVNSLDDYEISFSDNTHVLGSSQILVRKKGADSILFSSDIGPYICANGRKNPSADILILDPTCGNRDTKTYDESYLLETLKENLIQLSGPIIIQGHTGTIEKIIPTLDELNWDIYLSDKLEKIYSYYKSQGFASIDNQKKMEGIGDFKSGDTFFYLRYKTESTKVGSEAPFYHPEKGTTVNLGALHDKSGQPWESWGGETVNFYFTAHANFNTTVDYINSVNPKKLYIDNTRAQSLNRCRNLITYLKENPAIKKELSMDILS